jgi:hypothetical protein
MRYYAYTYSQYIYDAANFPGTGAISSLSFYHNSTTAFSGTSFTVWVANTTKSTFSSWAATEYMPISQMTQVFSGPLSGASGAYWLEIPFNEEFLYTGDNLIVAIHANQSPYLSPYDRFYNTPTATNKSLQSYSDSSPINPSTPTMLGSATGYGLILYRPDIKFNICVAPLGEGDCDPPTGLVAEYDVMDCSVNLSWDGAIGGGGIISGSVSTQAAGNGSGAIMLDVIAGSENVTITDFQTYFNATGSATIHVYYREGTSCGHGTDPDGWIFLGETTSTISGTGSYILSDVFEMPGVLTIPAGQTYGIYLGTFVGNRVCYYNGIGSTCGQTTVASNSHLTIKGSQAMTTPAAPFTGSVYTERCFAGVINYNVGSEVSYNIYRDGSLIVSHYEETFYTDNDHNPYESHEWCVSQMCPNGYPAQPYTCIELDACAINNCDESIVGTGTTTHYLTPINTYWNYSYIQHIYDASEIGSALVDKNITSLSFQYIHTSCVVDKSIVIYIGHTTKSTFSSTSDWVLPADMQLVFDGTYTLTNADPWCTVDLDIPFLYHGGNLVVAILNNTGSYLCTSSTPTFRYHTTTGNKTLHAYRDATPPYNPGAPGAGNATANVRSNILFTACEPLDHDLIGRTITGNINPSALVPYKYTVKVYNNGLNPENDFRIKVVTSTNVELASLNVTQPIAPGETMSYDIFVTFQEEGNYCIKGRVDLIGDQNPANNPTPLLCLNVRPYSEDDIIDIPSDPWIGQSNSLIPFYFVYESSLAQSVYYQSDMGIPGGLIKELSWYFNNTVSFSNYPIQVAMANVTTPSVATSWIPESEFTTVYEGNISLPTGLYKLTIPLPEENWFLYTGSNLVVMSNHMFRQPWFTGINGITTSAVPNGRSRYTYRDGGQSVLGDASSPLNVISNIELVVRRTPYGIVTGVITDCETGEPLSGVSLVLDKYGITATTNAQGEYILPFLPAGEDYTIYASRYLYYDMEFGPFHVEEDSEYSYDFCMDYLDGFILYGVVQAADGTYIEGATLTLTGYVDYPPITSGPMGTFEFLGVLWARDYQLMVTAPGYQNHVSMHDVLENVNVGTIILYDLTYPPVDVVATRVEEFAEITWGPFVLPPYDDWIKWCVNDDVAGRVGYDVTAGDNMTIAMRFTPADLKDLGVYSGHMITKIAIGIGTDMYSVNSMEFRIWEGGSSITDAGNLVYTQPITGWTSFTENMMLEFDLETPFVINSTQELRIGWNLVNTAGYPFGRDAGPVVAGKGDLITCSSLWGGDWVSHMSQLGWNYNYSIKAYVTGGGKSATQVLSSNAIPTSNEPTQSVSANQAANLSDIAYGQPRSIFVERPVEVVQSRIVPEVATSRGVIGYRLWRLQPGQEGNPAVWSTLTNVPVDGLEYMDYSWENVPVGTYKWAVKTVYHGMIESDPEFSNNLVKRYKDDFKVNVTTNSNDIPTGAVVTLIGGGDTHTATVAVNEVNFADVYHGTYSLKVTLAGFYDYTAQVKIDGHGQSHTATLIEIIKNPFDLNTEEIDCNVLFTWDHELAGSKHFMFYNVYLDHKIKAEGLTATEYLFTDLAPGAYTFSVQAHYSSINSAIVNTVYELLCEGIDDIELGYNIYPNPTSSHLTIERENAISATIDLYNAMGMHIATYETLENTYEINVSALSAGTYFIRLTEGATSSVKSFVKQ